MVLTWGMASGCDRGSARERVASEVLERETVPPGGAEREAAAAPAAPAPGVVEVAAGQASGAVVPGSIEDETPNPLGGDEVSEDRLAAWETSCEAGEADACSYLAWYGYVLGEVRGADAARALALFERSCEGGSALGCSNLGYVQMEGLAGSPDLEVALEAFERACALGSGLGCSNLGWYFYGPEAGVRPDPARAMELYAQACEMGVALGCTNLAMNELERESAEGDAAAARALARGCALGSPNACNDLGWYVYTEGRGGTMNPQGAVEVFGWACERGQGNSCASLGAMLLDGILVERDVEQAIILLREGCQRGSEYACERLTGLLGLP